MGKGVGLIAIMWLSTLMAFASGEVDDKEILRPVAASYTIEAGSSHIADTYLSPLKYSGWTIAFGYDRLQAMKFNPEQWIMNLHLELGVDKADNPVKNATIWGAGVASRWGMLWRHHIDNRVTLAIGGSTGLNFGALYTSRNGNNPVAAKASWTINLSFLASWKGAVLGIPVTMTYRPTLPLAGIFFSQQYGELYYEIYLGNRDGLIHGAFPWNYFSLDNLLTADFGSGSTRLRLGYHNTIVSTNINNLTTRMISHSFVAGVSGEWFSFNPRHLPSPQTRCVSARY